MKPIPVTRENAIFVGRKFAEELGVPESRAIAATEAWFDSAQQHKSRDEHALREYLKTRFR